MILYFVALIIPLIISSASIPFIIRLSDKLRMHDTPSDRKIHKRPISRLGGVSIFASFAVTFFIFINMGYIRTEQFFQTHLYIIAFCLAFALGLLDDMVKIRARYKLIIQIFIAAVASISGLLINRFTFLTVFSIDFGFMAYPLTIIWIVVFMNAINLIDGMDGLASGIIAISSIFIFIISIMNNNIAVSFISLILLGSVVGFYLYNFPPAKIFMGDGGAYFLGFMYSTIGLMGIKKSSIAVLFAIPIVLLLVPILDTIQAIFRRIKNKRNIFLPDKGHLHHRLLDIGFSQKNILFIVYIFSAILGIFSILIVLLPKEYAFLILILILLLVYFSFFLIIQFEKQVQKIKAGNNNEKQTDR